MSVESHDRAGLLNEQVMDRRREISTDGYAMSIGELASLYEDDELEIQPEYQRFFRWTPEQKARLIESILLGIPLPQIFVSQRDDGVWEVVDGLQRLSAVFEFMGKLKVNNGTEETKGLAAVKYLPALEGMTWQDLPKKLTLDFRRTKMNISIIRRGGDERAKYELFQRLNTGGSPLSAQEVRNCILIMKNESFFEWLGGLAELSGFVDCVAISDRLKDEGYHMELASRLIVLSSVDPKHLQGDIGIFVTDRLVEMAKTATKQRERWKRVFSKTFSILGRPALGDRAFKRYNDDDDRFKGGFLISPFEAVGCGIAYNLYNGSSADSYTDDLVLRKIKEMWIDPEFKEFTRSGRQAMSRLRRSIPYGRRLFATGSTEQ